LCNESESIVAEERAGHAGIARSRARNLATEARDTFAKSSGSHGKSLAGLDAFLARP
jgi:hypothetical protein